MVYYLLKTSRYDGTEQLSNVFYSLEVEHYEDSQNERRQRESVADLVHQLYSRHMILQ